MGNISAETHKYENIIHRSRPVSEKHPPMSMVSRGAQFSPFAALVGYGEVLQEAQRLTAAETILDEHGKELLDRKLRRIAQDPQSAGEVAFCYFEQDSTKPGGRYVTLTGKVKRVDAYRKSVLMVDGEEIWIENIRDIDGVD